MAHNDHPSWPWYLWPLAPIAFLLLLVALLSIPFAYMLMSINVMVERRFRRKMDAQDRFLSWDDLLPALNDGSGTLIIEQANKLPVRVWWTPDDVLAIAPCPPPDDDQLQCGAVSPPKTPHPFVSWCHQRYMHEHTGTALLTLPSLELPPSLFASFFQEHFPRLSAIDTVFC
jgi:hypothetical protein